jgi:hypothetical protein
MDTLEYERNYGVSLLFPIRSLRARVRSLSTTNAGDFCDELWRTLDE